MRRVAGFVLALAAGFAPAGLQAQGGNADLHGLPARFKDPVRVSADARAGVGSHYVAVVLSGDGGFASLVTQLSAGLAAHGIGVVEFNSREWLSPAKTPEQTAVAVVRAVRAAQARFGGDSLVIVGYSRGADMAPFVANRLPEDLRKVLGGIAMFGPANTANFEFHMVDLIKDTARDSDVPILPELKMLEKVRITCVYGTDEKSSLCRDAPTGLMHVEMRKGGHHFDGEDSTLANVVLRMLKIPVLP